MAVVALAMPVAGHADPSPCPAPKTCQAYVLDDYRWPVQAGQPLVIPYFVGDTISPPGVSASQLPAVVAAATALWTQANPRVTFHYEGTTSALPGAVDGQNVIGYAAPIAPGAEAAHATINFTAAGQINEEDISIDPTHVWTWQPCPQQDGGCTGHTESYADYPVFNSPAVWGPELQGVLEHELGHWLSLDHPDASGGTEMTMASSTPFDNLRMQTLGLGDVMGVRAAYPCGTCGGPPVVYDP